MPTTCNINNVILISIVIVIIAFTNEIFTNMPILLTLFTNPTNFILLNILVILVLLINLPMGIILTFTLLYLSVYVKNILNTKQDKIDNIILTSNLIKLNNTELTKSGLLNQHPMANNISNTVANTVSNNIVSNNTVANTVSNNTVSNNTVSNNTVSNNTVANTVSNNIVSNNIVDNNTIANTVSNNSIINNTEINNNSSIDMTQLLSDSEFNYNNSAPFPNNNLSPLQLTNIINVSNVNKKCDYKYKDSQHNMTLYGPPLASCNTYNKEQIAMCGTPFYPINS